MNFLTRMMAFLSFFVMVQNVNAAGNSVYVDQIGDGTNISITQTGSGNQIGSSNNRSTFNGNNNTITIQQIGNSNVTNKNVNGDGATITTNITGNSNTTEVNCGANGGSCGASNITKNITGDGNTVNVITDNLTNTAITINSDNNTVNLTNTSTAVAGTNNTIDISGGNGNQVDITQAGVASSTGHAVDLTIVGALNTVELKQGGSVDSKINSTITGSSNNLTVKSNHQ